jgi:hypothetical protein
MLLFQACLKQHRSAAIIQAGLAAGPLGRKVKKAKAIVHPR